MADAPKVEFALGSEVSPGHFFKSSFARSFISNCRDAKSLDYEFLDNGTIAEEPESNCPDARNNNQNNSNNAGNNNNHFFSLVDFGSFAARDNSSPDNTVSTVWKTSAETTQCNAADVSELEKLRKQCQTLTEENRKLQSALSSSQVPHVQTIDNVFLQTQVETLQWQLKQTESNRHMYRSLMEQVVRFLDRARKSLDILHEKSNPKGGKGSSGRVPRSRSVHAVHVADSSSPSRASAGNNPSTGAGTANGGVASRFTRAKSVAQITPSSCSSIRDLTWSVLRRNDPVHCTPPRAKPCQEQSKPQEGIVYRRPKQPELDPDEVPPQKLAQEAFRLMRTVQSLLSMREPDLARVTPIEEQRSSASPTVDNQRDASLSLPMHGNFANSTALTDSELFAGAENDSGRGRYLKTSTSVAEFDGSLRNLLPGVRRSLDATSLNSGSSKTTEEEDLGGPLNGATTTTTTSHDEHRRAERPYVGASSTPCRRPRKQDSARSSRSKPSTSVSSAEDESGFSSMSSFQEVGLPTSPAPTTTTTTTATSSGSPAKGCHTEIGLPEIPLNLPPTHRRWSSTPAEIQALLKRHSAAAAAGGHHRVAGNTTDALSVWV